MASHPEFAKWFEELLEYRNLTQADAARRLGIGTGRMSEWMTGKARPSAESCRKIARVFLVDEDEVLVAAGRRTPDPHYDPMSAEARLIPVIRSIEWTPAMIEGAAQFLIGIEQMARELQGINLDPGLGEDTRHVNEIIRTGPSDE